MRCSRIFAARHATSLSCAQYHSSLLLYTGVRCTSGCPCSFHWSPTDTYKATRELLLKAHTRARTHARTHETLLHVLVNSVRWLTFTRPCIDCRADRVFTEFCQQVTTLPRDGVCTAVAMAAVYRLVRCKVLSLCRPGLA